MFNSPHFRNRVTGNFFARNPQGFPEPPTAVANRSDATPRRPDANVASVRDFTERSRRTLENTKKLVEKREREKREREEREREIERVCVLSRSRLSKG